MNNCYFLEVLCLENENSRPVYMTSIVEGNTKVRHIFGTTDKYTTAIRWGLGCFRSFRKDKHTVNCYVEGPFLSPRTSVYSENEFLAPLIENKNIFISALEDFDFLIYSGIEQDNAFCEITSKYGLSKSQEEELRQLLITNARST